MTTRSIIPKKRIGFEAWKVFIINEWNIKDEVLR